jgi:hypothetical protein
MEPRQFRIQEYCTPTIDGSTPSGSLAAEVLKLVEASSDCEECPICLVQEDTMFVWKETSCGHRFHGRCVKRWLEMKPGCPICRCQLLIPPVDAEEVYRPPNLEHLLHTAANQYVPPLHPHVLRTIEIMERNPEDFPNRHTDFPRWYASLVRE